MRKILIPVTQLIIYPAFFYFFLIITTSVSSSQENSAINGVPIPNEQSTDKSYSYVTEGRTDPFKPFISPKATTPVGVDPNEIVEENTELTGLRLFEPGQLVLVGVLTSDTGEIAMVEDQTKKGYFLKQGDLIGKRGVVTQIDKQQVVVTETAHTRAGKEINNTVIMRLHKEGDK